MGQQQLILLVLGTIIVGVAIVLGIRAFTENSAKSNADAMTQEAVRFANDMQAWKKKPAPFGGQGATQTPAIVAAGDNFTGATWALLGYNATSDTEMTTLNGTFTLTPGTDPRIVGENTAEGNRIEVVLCGMRDTDVMGATVNLAGADVGDAPACGAAAPAP